MTAEQEALAKALHDVNAIEAVTFTGFALAEKEKSNAGAILHLTRLISMLSRDLSDDERAIVANYLRDRADQVEVAMTRRANFEFKR